MEMPIRSRNGDASGLFRYLAAQQECMDSLYGWQPSPSSEPIWMTVNHTEADGLLGFRQILQQLGVQAKRVQRRTRNVPFAYNLPSSSTLQWLLRHLMNGGSQWRAFDVDYRPEPDGSALPQTRAFRIFSQDETLRFRRMALRLGVSLNTYLLHTLHQSISSELLPGENPATWMVPVDVRPLARHASNAISCVLATIEPGDSVLRLHRQIRDNLHGGQHVAIWKLLSYWDQVQILSSIGFNPSPPELAGIFSNLGEWTSDHPNGIGGWLTCPPVTRFMPLGAGAVTWQGRLGLTMQTHPALRSDQADVESWMAAWIARAHGGNTAPHWRFLRTTGSTISYRETGV
jgi:hypothetical protein